LTRRFDLRFGVEAFVVETSVVFTASGRENN